MLLIMAYVCAFPSGFAKRLVLSNLVLCKSQFISFFFCYFIVPTQATFLLNNLRCISILASSYI